MNFVRDKLPKSMKERMRKSAERHHSTCKHCGEKIVFERDEENWIAKDLRGKKHRCRPKCRRLTKEEIEKMNKERGFK